MNTPGILAPVAPSPLDGFIVLILGNKRTLVHMWQSQLVDHNYVLGLAKLEYPQLLGTEIELEVLINRKFVIVPSVLWESYISRAPQIREIRVKREEDAVLSVDRRRRLPLWTEYATLLTEVGLFLALGVLGWEKWFGTGRSKPQPRRWMKW